MRNRRPARVASSATRADVVGVGLVGAQPLGVVALAGHRAVEGEADRVEDAGLAGAGGAREQEQPGRAERVEVDRRGVGERPERRDLQPVQPHPRTRRGGAAACRRRGRRSTRRRRPGGARPRRRWRARRAARATKSRAMSWSDVRPGRAVGTPVASRLAGLEGEHQGVREPAAQPLHRLRRPHGVGEGDLHPARLVTAPAPGRPAASSSVPRSRASGRGTGAVDELGVHRRRRPRGRPASEPLVWACSEKE